MARPEWRDVDEAEARNLAAAVGDAALRIDASVGDAAALGEMMTTELTALPVAGESSMASR